MTKNRFSIGNCQKFFIFLLFILAPTDVGGEWRHLKRWKDQKEENSIYYHTFFFFFYGSLEYIFLTGLP